VNELNVRKVLGGIHFINISRSETLQPCSEFDIICSNPCLITESSNASPGSTVHFFGSGDRGFLKEGVKAYQMTPISPYKSLVYLFFLLSHI
jgi:hypothetical protein